MEPKETVMIIDSVHAEVVPLSLEWRSLVHQKDDDKGVASFAFQRALAQEVMAPICRSFPGELVLTYHQFLALRPTGTHSFAFGSEMVMEYTYSVQVGRMKASAQIMETPERRHVIGHTAIVTLPQFLLPVEWRVQLWPRYRHSNTPTHYCLEQSEKKAAEFQDIPLDLSWFGQHLFSVRVGKYDYATQVALVVGNDSVKRWLHEHGSDQLYNELVAR